MSGVRFGTSLTYAAMYVAAFVLGRATLIEGSGLAMFWPAAGIAALWMLRGVTRDQVTLDALLLVLTTFALNLIIEIDPLPAALFSLANMLQGFVVRLVIAWFQRARITTELMPRLRTAGDLLQLGVGCLAAAAVTGPVVTFGVWLNDGVWSTSTWMTWAVRNACGAFVVCAAVLAVRGARRERLTAGKSVPEALAGEPRRYVIPELAAAIALTSATAGLVLASQQELPIGFVMLASSAWIGFRFTPVVAGVHTLVFGCLSVLSSLLGWGPFGEIADLTTRGIIVQTFVAVTAVITLMLSLGVAERSRLLDRLRDSEQDAKARAGMLDAVTEALTDGLAVVDHHGNMLISNPAFYAMTGGPGPDDGERVADPRARGFFRADGEPLPDEELPHLQALAGRFVPPTDYLRIDPATGAQTIFSCTAVPLRLTDDANEPPLAVALVHDVTLERAQTRELEAFAGVVAHDLENPLAALMNWAEILDEQLDSLDEDASPARASLVKIYRSADQMQQLIRDLLVLTQASSSELELTSVSLDAVVDDASQEVIDHASGMRPRIERGHLGRVHADETLVRQVFSNLVANAVKYVASGVQPVVKISAQRNGNLIEVKIRDNGVGIPASERGKVFDAWYRSESTSNQYPGTGLGLSITSRAVGRHGGTITAREGPDGHGSIFTFTLPADPGPLLRVAPPLPSDESPSGRPGSAVS